VLKVFCDTMIAYVAVVEALTMSNEARKTTTVGEIVNLMSVDAQRLQEIAGYLWMTWSSPVQICIAVYMLWDMLGVSVLAGIAVMILLIPINGIVATKTKKLQVSANSRSALYSSQISTLPMAANVVYHALQRSGGLCRVL